MLLLQEFDFEKESKNHVADHLSRLSNDEVTERKTEVLDEFPHEKLMIIHERPWFADMANFKATGITLEDMD